MYLRTSASTGCDSTQYWPTAGIYLRFVLSQWAQKSVQHWINVDSTLNQHCQPVSNVDSMFCAYWDGPQVSLRTFHSFWVINWSQYRDSWSESVAIRKHLQVYILNKIVSCWKSWFFNLLWLKSISVSYLSGFSSKCSVLLWEAPQIESDTKFQGFIFYKTASDLIFPAATPNPQSLLASMLSPRPWSPHQHDSTSRRLNLPAS